MQTQTTAKRRRRSMPDTLRTIIYQPNHITNARYNFTLFQERIFTYVMFYLQHYVERLRAGEQLEQMEIFASGENIIKIYVPLDFIVPNSPAQYNKVRESAKAMASLVIQVPYKDRKGRSWQEFTGMFSVHLEAGEKKRSKHVVMGIRRDIALLLVDFDKKDGKIVNYTSFMFEYAMNAKHKYTPRIYKYISSWKEKGTSYPIELEEFKAMIGCAGEYKTYTDFKRRVLVPAAKELQDIADCWFDIDYDKFETLTNGKVSHLTFRVTTADEKLTYCKLWDNIWYLMKTHFSFTENQIQQLKDNIKTDKVSPKDVYNKIIDLYRRLQDGHEIKDIKSYAMKVLLREFA